MDDDVKQRLKWVKLYEETHDAGLVCGRCGISRPTLRKWLRRYTAEGEAGLHAYSRRPKRSPNRKVTAQIEQQVLELRQRLNVGVRRLQNELWREYGLRLGLETIHKILRKHEVPPLQQPQRSRAVKRYQKAIPGERVQMDTCKVRPGVYLYTAIDDCSRYLVVGVYARRSAKNTIHFITERVLEEMHFPIQRFQTDNGTEFTAYPVQDLLAAYAIKFRPIRPRTPHLNGKVERAQRTVLTEFFATLDGSVQALSQIDDALAVWQHDYNWFRIHGSLGRPPQDKLHELSAQTPFWDQVIANYDPAVEQQLMHQRLGAKRSAR